MKSSAKMRNAQMALMLLIGVVIALIFLMTYFLVSSIPRSAQFTFDHASIQGYVGECLKQAAEEGIILLGKQGGRIQLQQGYISAPSFGISYALRNNASTLPPLALMEEELSSYIDGHAPRCLKNFEDFKKRGWKVEAGDFRTSALINVNDVALRSSFPFTVTYKENTLSFQDFSLTLPVRLNYLHAAMVNTANFSLEQDRRVDMSYLDGLGFNTTIFPYKGALVYRFIDEESAIRNGPYEFLFAIQ